MLDVEMIGSTEEKYPVYFTKDELDVVLPTLMRADYIGGDEGMTDEQIDAYYANAVAKLLDQGKKANVVHEGYAASYLEHALSYMKEKYGTNE